MTMKKCVYIVQSHHHVIKEWFRHRECGSHLLSFDCHTDFCEAFLKNSYAGSSASILERTYTIQNHNLVLGKHIACRDENAIESAVNDLRNDQHIDFAR